MSDMERKDQEDRVSGQQAGQNPQEAQISQEGQRTQIGQGSQSGQHGAQPAQAAQSAQTGMPSGPATQPGQADQPVWFVQGQPAPYPYMAQPGLYAAQGWVPQGQQGAYSVPGWPMQGQPGQPGAQPGQPGVQPGQPGVPHPQNGSHSFRAGGYPSPSPQWAPYSQPEAVRAQGPYPGQTPSGAAGPAPYAQDKTASRQLAGTEAGDRYEDLKTAPFYNERYRKPGKGRMKGLVGPMIAIGLVCSILGGAITGGIMYAYRSDLLGSIPSPQPSQAAAADGPVRRVEILNRTEEPITAIAEKAGPSVVGINVEYTYNDSFFGTQEGGGQGSGIIISADGYILTNNHVVEAAANTGSSRTRFSNTGRITVVLPSHPDEPYEASIVGLDSKTDIAVIKIDAQNLPVAEIGDSDALVIGELAVAIGNPAGLEYMGSVTSGIISGLNRRVDTGDGNMLRLIQTDAAISPGNSGGALLNAEGQVIGVNSSKIGGTSYEGLGFAIPIKDAMAIANSLMTDGFVVRPQIGVSIDNTFTAEVAKANKVPVGVLVGEVMEGSPAQDAGILPFDIITAFNGIAITSYDELEEEKNKFNPGDTIKLTVYRIPEGAQPAAGKSVELELTLGSTANTK